MLRFTIYIVAVYLLMDAAFADTSNSSSSGEGEIVNLHKRKKSDSHESTSSESGRIRSGSSSSSGSDSLEMDSSESTSSSESTYSKQEKKNKYVPPDSIERPGWRKWHRKCKPCPEDAMLKWRDQSIEWICGQYQRARRSFKSRCMMEYRNCQDGTMFTKLRDGKCKNESSKLEYYHGDHFFYEYKVSLSQESSGSKSSSTTSESSEDSYSY